MKLLALDSSGLVASIKLQKDTLTNTFTYA